MDLSIIEYFVFGFVCYSTVLMGIIGIAKELPSSRSLSPWRILGLFPGLVAAGVLTVSGVNIDLSTDTTISTTKDLNSSEVWSQTTTHTSQIVLLNPVWQIFHMMLFLFLLIFVIYQVITLMSKTD